MQSVLDGYEDAQDIAERIHEDFSDFEGFSPPAGADASNHPLPSAALSKSPSIHQREGLDPQKPLRSKSFSRRNASILPGTGSSSLSSSPGSPSIKEARATGMDALDDFMDATLVSDLVGRSKSCTQLQALQGSAGSLPGTKARELALTGSPTERLSHLQSTGNNEDGKASGAPLYARSSSRTLSFGVLPLAVGQEGRESPELSGSYSSNHMHSHHSNLGRANSISGPRQSSGSFSCPSNIVAQAAGYHGSAGMVGSFDMSPSSSLAAPPRLNRSHSTVRTAIHSKLHVSSSLGSISPDAAGSAAPAEICPNLHADLMAHETGERVFEGLLSSSPS
jgi:hypothetical protein